VCVRAGKSARYLRSILNQLGLTHRSATLIYVHNLAAIMMANAGKPTERSRHIDVQYFALLQWVKDGDVLLVHIAGIWNPSDALTKPLGWVIHHRHCYRVAILRYIRTTWMKLHHAWSITALFPQSLIGGGCRCNIVSEERDARVEPIAVRPVTRGATRPDPRTILDCYRMHTTPRHTSTVVYWSTPEKAGVVRAMLPMHSKAGVMGAMLTYSYSHLKRRLHITDRITDSPHFFLFRLLCSAVISP
jgi:hypothetical protein